ncbi:NAD(P)-binding domain-containing protein, partial [Paenibacillus macerans]
MRENIGFIGLGLLGLPVAANLLQAGYALTVYNRTADKAEPLVAQGAVQA